MNRRSRPCITPCTASRAIRRPNTSRDRADNHLAAVGDEHYPIVITTYRLTEHHVSGPDDALDALAQRAATITVRRTQPRTGGGDATSRTASG